MWQENNSTVHGRDTCWPYPVGMHEFALLCSSSRSLKCVGNGRSNVYVTSYGWDSQECYLIIIIVYFLPDVVIC